MHRFFVKPEQIGEREIRILGGDVNHISHVLRMRPGDELCVCDGDKMEYTSRILEISPEEIRVEILYGQEQGLELPCRVTLFQGLPKGDKMELIVQKAVELGAWEIVPMATRRAVVKLDRKKEEAKLRRWQGIAESAAKQAKRMRIPKVCPVMTFAQAAEYAAGMEVRLIPYELAKDMSATRKVLEGIRPGQRVGIFIGPEGGFDPEEVELACAHGITPITLGKRILRTETAGFALLSILMYLLEE